jgi:hypothetical protein
VVDEAFQGVLTDSLLLAVAAVAVAAAAAAAAVAERV